jgi:hypothetical protein
MAARVVCISRTQAALGETIGNLVAERLGFEYVDEQVIERAARLAQVDPSVVAKVEQRRPLLRRLVEKMAAARDLLGPTALAPVIPMFGGTASHGGSRAQVEDLRLLIQAAIHEIATRGDAVIVAHAASMTLSKRDDVLRVLVTASDEARARRVAEVQGITVDAAAAVIARSDRDRQDYFARFHDISQELATHYDLVINTDGVIPERAAELIASAARGRAS